MVIDRLKNLSIGDIFIKHGTRYRVSCVTPKTIIATFYRGEIENAASAPVNKSRREDGKTHWIYLHIGANSQELVEVVYSATR